MEREMGSDVKSAETTPPAYKSGHSGASIAPLAAIEEIAANEYLAPSVYRGALLDLLRLSRARGDV
jgi:hypothetical protein